MKASHILVLAAVGAMTPAMAHAHRHKAAVAAPPHASTAHGRTHVPAAALGHVAPAGHHAGSSARLSAASAGVSSRHGVRDVEAVPHGRGHAQSVHLTRAEQARQARQEADAERVNARHAGKRSTREIAESRREEAEEARRRARMTPAQRRREDREEALAEAHTRGAQRETVAAERRTVSPHAAAPATGVRVSRGSVPVPTMRVAPDPAPETQANLAQVRPPDADDATAPATPDPELSRVRHNRKQHFHPAPVSPAAAAPQGGNAADTAAGAPKAALGADTPASADSSRTGVAMVEEVASIDPPAPSPAYDGMETVAAAPVRRVPAPVVRQAPETVVPPRHGASAAFPTRNPAPMATPAEARSQPVAEVRIPTVSPVLASSGLVMPVAGPEVILYDKRGQLIVPAALKGSHEILVHQNVMANADGLDRIQDDADLDAMRTGKLLVALPEGPGLRLDERLPLNRRYCRPWTAMFLKALSQAHFQRFGTPLQVNSAVRTVEFQQRLQRTNGNAAPAEGETASPHLTGQAVDLAKRGLSMTEIAWMRGYLLPLVQEGKIDVEEEFQQACFHISVYRRYVPQAPARRVITTRTAGTSLASAVGLP